MNFRVEISKIICCASLVILLLLSIQNPAYSTPTRWEKIDMSLEQLLNNGWRVLNHSSNRAATAAAPGVSSSDIETYSFLLTKNDSHIICLLQNPSPPISKAAGCRRLN
jgi:hypothetical protein